MAFIWGPRPCGFLAIVALGALFAPGSASAQQSPAGAGSKKPGETIYDEGADAKADIAAALARAKRDNRRVPDRRYHGFLFEPHQLRFRPSEAETSE